MTMRGEQKLPMTVTRERGGNGQRRSLCMYCPCSACDGRAMESGCRVPTCVHVEDAVMKGMREQGVEIGMMGCGTRVRARRVLEAR